MHSSSMQHQVTLCVHHERLPTIRARRRGLSSGSCSPTWLESRLEQPDHVVGLRSDALSNSMQLADVDSDGDL
jgi:hypothetical protein